MATAAAADDGNRVQVGEDATVQGDGAEVGEGPSRTT